MDNQTEFSVSVGKYHVIITARSLGSVSQLLLTPEQANILSVQMQRAADKVEVTVS